MRIYQDYQYNQGIGKYKLLSSTAGVGSIITTKFGTYILISDINKWQFIRVFNNTIKKEFETSTKEIDKQIEKEAEKLGLSLVDDKRFVNFIKREKELQKLECLVAIPQMAINENSNSISWTKKTDRKIEPNHPIASALIEFTGQPGRAQDYQIQGTHFPKWFRNDKGVLMEISDWKKRWIDKGNSINSFAPPRDAESKIMRSDNNQEIKTYTNANNENVRIPLYKELTQLNLILICPNGHLSDIPWARYLRWKTLKTTNKLDNDDNGQKLFEIDKCCNKPKLKWSESKNKSEGYGSVFIECLNCSMGSNDPKITLEGINSLKPFCKGQKPWEMELNNTNIPYEECYKKGDQKNGREEMQVALVTANNTYYASGFSSLYIPMSLAEEIPKDILGAVEILNKRFTSANERKQNNNQPQETKDVYWDKQNIESFIYDDQGLNPDNYENFVERLKFEFLQEPDMEEDTDFHEKYRFQEFRSFSNNSSYEHSEKRNELSFKEIKLDELLSKYFTRIHQVDELKVTNIQFDFTRVDPKERLVRFNKNGDREIIESSSGQNIFSISKDELYVLPANETFGEGLFFQLNDKKIDEWLLENSHGLNERFDKFLNREINFKQQGASFMQKIKNNGIKHFLIHSFSHMMMRELEFSCGYPTASLKERLYISKDENTKMSGVLIYTAEGSEGSMGGLVSQGDPEKILEIIMKGLERSINCSSDPLCWESDGQGIFDLNLSACFSCSLVAETACEEMNLGLDRRVLVDEEFGYFKDMLF